MKRNFYLVNAVLWKMQQLTPTKIVDSIFTSSDVKDHLLEKLTEVWLQFSDYGKMLESFYLKLDSPHQMMFDAWFNGQMEEINETTVPY